MELDQLKNTWNKYAGTDVSKHRLDESELRRMLKRKANGLIDRINRNVRIGFVVIAALVLFFVIDDLFITPNMAGDVAVPVWIYLIDWLNTLFLLGTFLYFWLQYKRVKSEYSQSNDMHRVLSSSVKLLLTYRRLFYWSLSVLLLAIAVSVVAGFFANPNLGSEVLFSEHNQAVVLRSFAILLGVLALIFLIFHWGFRRLYGRYIAQLEETLAELEEID
ncbi:hypothetical protein [Mangrovibacterium sp.]|uniref:hypothetical protein n=1 Tax=Mangrovibacterium sp. TaxID=1961364 RepID=UPI003565A253